ncbi:MAG: SulP family inorganic anion transporter [Deltaproteobacteria bacterium]|nr:SulP family inorganic anion transporter [Deltaproteobacteria bacterium]
MAEISPSSVAGASAASAEGRPADRGRAAALRGDLLAGVTSGILAVPQGIAFALIAHVPPEHGLYAMIVPTIVAALIRSSPFLVTGATNTSALVIGALVAAFAAGPGEAVPMMLLITLLMGLIQVSAGALKLGAFGRYVSQAVLVGFTLGAATLIFTDQVRNVLGLSVESSPRLLKSVENLLPQVGDADGRALAIAAVTWGVLWACSRISPAVPGAMIAIVVTGAGAWMLGWEDAPAAVQVVGDVPGSLPRPTLPPLSVDRVASVVAASFAIALLGMVEAISIGKALSARAQSRFYANQELFAKGAGNVVGAFFGCMPSSASWIRSAIHLRMGAQTRWVGVISGLTVLAVMLVFAPAARYVPRACLGAIIMWTAVLMIDLQAARYVSRWSRADAVVLVVTYASTLVFQIQYAIYLGVVLSLLMLVRRIGELQMVEMVEVAPRLYREIDIDEQTGRSALVLLALEGDLFFGVVEELEEHLSRIAANGARAIVIRMKRAHAIDATAAESLANFATHFRGRGGRLMLCGLKAELHAQIAVSHLGEVLGRDNVLLTDNRHLGSLRRAIHKARREILSGAPLGDRPLFRRAADHLDDGSSYSI